MNSQKPNTEVEQNTSPIDNAKRKVESNLRVAQLKCAISEAMHEEMARYEAVGGQSLTPNEIHLAISEVSTDWLRGALNSENERGGK